MDENTDLPNLSSGGYLKMQFLFLIILASFVLINSMGICAGGNSSDFNLPTEEGGFVSFPSKDGFKIFARFYFPDVLETRKYPVVVYLHGGPHSTFLNEAQYFFPTLNKAGFIVFAINYRGSKGYDNEYYTKIVGDIGGRDVDDVISGMEFLKKYQSVDLKNLILMGHSYGGYLTHMVISLHPGIFAKAVAMSGPVDLFEQFNLLELNVSQGLVETSVLEEMRRDAGQTNNIDFLKKRSPTSYLQCINVPVLIVHGRKDVFCPIQPIEKFFLALKKKGLATAIFLDKANHDLGLFEHSDHQQRLLEKIIKWIDSRNFPPTLK